MIIEGFYAFLSNAISATTRSVYPHVIPQDSEFPAVTYSISSDVREPILDGISSLKQAVFNVDCWDVVYKSSHELADVIEAAMLAHGGLFGAVEVNHVRLERRFDLLETQTGLFRVSMQFLVAYY